MHHRVTVIYSTFLQARCYLKRFTDVPSKWQTLGEGALSASAYCVAVFRHSGRALRHHDTSDQSNQSATKYIYYLQLAVTPVPVRVNVQIVVF